MAERGNNFRKLFEPSFLICVLVLGTAGAGKKAILEWSGAQLTKKPVPIKKSLDLMDTELLHGYAVVEKIKIKHKEILEELGTREYIQLVLEDTEADSSSATRFCNLFITYYGEPGVVPHVPEECYVGGGNQQLSRESITLSLDPDSDGIIMEKIGEKLKVRHLVFVSKSSSIWRNDFKFDRLYVFKVNNSYANDRTGVRELLGRNLFGKYSFFSKIEWGFYGNRQGRTIRGNSEELARASEKLLSRILPILEKEHWPDWEELNKRDKKRKLSDK